MVLRSLTGEGHDFEGFSAFCFSCFDASDTNKEDKSFEFIEQEAKVDKR